MELGNGRFPRKRFTFSNIAGDPFWLGTIGIGISGWVIAFVGSILADTDGGGYPNYSWWTLVYMLLCICGVIFVVGSDSVETYHVALSSFIAAGMVMTTSAVNSLIYYSISSKEAAAAGYILLSIDAIIWVFYFGSQPQAGHRQTLQSFALHKDRPMSRTSRTMHQSYRPETMLSNSQPPQMYNSSHLAGFETSSPITGYSSGGAGFPTRQSTAGFPSAGQPQSRATDSVADWQNMGGNIGHVDSRQDGEEEVPEYKWKAKAIYSYDASPQDKNELSFAKHEILELCDISGRWWKGRRFGTEEPPGIAPSNYLILL